MTAKRELRSGTHAVTARTVWFAFALFLCALSANASEIIFATAPGALNGTTPVSIQAIFDLSPNSIKITVTNYQDNPTDVTQGLSGLAFQPTGQGMNIVQPKLDSSNSAEIYIEKNGTHTDPVPVSSTSWALSTSGVPGGLPLAVCRINCGVGGADQLVLGNWGPNGLYSNANGSIGNDAHNPFLYRTATFTVTGIQNATGINSVIFSFGTSVGQNVPGYYDYVVPEPATLALMLGGLVAVLGAARFSRRSYRSA